MSDQLTPETLILWAGVAEICGDGPMAAGLSFHAEAWQAQVEALEDALQRIANWSDAYPLDVFPEPDFKKAHEVLTAAGMTLDAISASNMRHVVEGVGHIAKAALAAGKEKT